MVRFNPKARLDQSRVRSSGSGGGGGGGLGGGGLGGGGMRLPIPTGRGGIGTIVILVILFLVGRCADVDVLGGGGGGTQANKLTDLSYANCETGEDANNSQDCARVAIENSITDYWQRTGMRELRGYEGNGSTKFRAIEGLYTFTGSVNTGCGQATSEVGPFYCPGDDSIYLDTTFFDNVLERQLGGPDGVFVEFYVLAHEYGHHISNIIGSMSLVTSQETGPESPAVRLELQADCFAGMWAANATQTKDADGNVLIEDVTEQDLDEAIDAAEAVGDDRIQEKTQGRTNPESWTHGSAEQRKYWFDQGFDGKTCDTFAAGSVQAR